MNVDQWAKFLPKDDEKREFILNDVQLGFKLSELDKPDTKKTLMKNYFSAFKYRHAVENQILEEIENDYRLHDVQLELAGLGRHRHRHVIADHLEGDLVHRLQ